jgi:GT2 family glycosyltransferase
VRLRQHSSPMTVRAAVVDEPPGKDRTYDVTAVIVTYNNRDSIGALLADLERERADLRIRIVVVDNDSRDGTFEVVAGYPDVVAVRGGGNLGYAGGINAARPHLGDTGAILVLNPDLRLDPGAVKALWRRLALPGVGISVPKILDEDGKTSLSLRFEPAVLRGLGEAVLGGRLAGRPDWLSEIDRSCESYRFAHAVDWATGACLMVRRDVAEKVGDWDERFFLYSEETDYMRRVREAGWNVWFEPGAIVRHEGGGSGQSPQLVALLAVNRVRYAEHYHGRMYATATRAVTLLGELARAGLSEGHRTAVRYLLSRSRWKTLPAATYTTVLENEPPGPWGAVIIPAHNEESVIRSTLAPLQPIAAAGKIDLVVAVNGSTDRTADYAGAFSGVRVLSLERPSKIAALNAAEAEVGSGPRLYLDADITITRRAVRDVLAVLRRGERLAARPPFRYDTKGATWPVRAYYRARERLPSSRRHLWGAGVYGLSEAGRSRFGLFPDIVADDLYVDSLFSDDEKLVVDTDSVIVRTPRTAAGLLAVLRRTYQGNRGVALEFSDLAGRQQSSSQTFRELLGSVRGPAGLVDAAVYAALAIAARLQSPQPTRWERDETSRRPDMIDAGGVGNDAR